MYSLRSSLVRSPLENCQEFATVLRKDAHYSLRTATVFLLQVETRVVRPSDSVPSRTLRALSYACFWMVSKATDCLGEKGHAEAGMADNSTTKMALIALTLNMAV